MPEEGDDFCSYYGKSLTIISETKHFGTFLNFLSNSALSDQSLPSFRDLCELLEVQ